MNNIVIKKRIALGLVMIGAIGLCQSALALTGMANIAYVGDGSGHLVLDGYGHCVRTSAWTPALALAECEPGMTSSKVAAQAPAPTPEPVATPTPAPPPAPAPEPAIQKVTLKAGALFDSGKSALKPAGKRELDDLATRLQAMHGIDSIEITGYTDSLGSAAFNQKLSVQRAEAVKSYLVNKGVAADLMTTRGLGASNPVASNATAAGRAQNRRVELKIKASQSAQ